jgi:MFS family permease
MCCGLHSAFDSTKEAVGLFRNRSFLLYWLGTAMSAIGDQVYLLVISWWVLEKTGSLASLGTVNMSAAIPRLALMVAGGVLADQWDRKRTMYVSNLLRALLIGGIGCSLLEWSSLPIWVMDILAFCFGVLDSIFWPASGSFLPMVVKKEDLTRANSVVQMFQQGSYILGPVAGAAFLKWWGFASGFLGDAVIIFLSALAIWQIRDLSLSGNIVGLPAPATRREHWLRDLIEGIRFSFRNPFLASIMVTSMFINLAFVGPLTVGLPAMAKEVYRTDEAGLSILTAALGFGTLVGATVLGIVNMKRHRGVVLAISAFILSLSIFSIGFTNRLYEGALSLMFVGIGLAMVMILANGLVQSTVHGDRLGRVMGLLMFFSVGLNPVSYGLTGFLAVPLGLKHLFIYSGLLVLIVILAGLLTPKTRRSILGMQ